MYNKAVIKNSVPTPFLKEKKGEMHWIFNSFSNYSFIFMHMFICLSIWMYVYIHFWMYVHIYIWEYMFMYILTLQGDIRSLRVGVTGLCGTPDLRCGCWDPNSASCLQGIFLAHNWTFNSLCFLLWMKSGQGQCKNTWQ